MSDHIFKEGCRPFKDKSSSRKVFKTLVSSLQLQTSVILMCSNVLMSKMAIILPTGQWYAPSAVINDAWYCMILHGIALYCIILHGIAWYCMELHGIAWYCMVLQGIALYCMVLHGIAWYCMILHIAWYGMVLHGIAWFCMVLHGIAWY